MPLAPTIRRCWLLLALAAAPAAAQKTLDVPSPLGAFSVQRVLVLPVQFLQGDSMSMVSPDQWGKVRKQLDDSIGAAIAGRGIGRRWGYAADVVRTSKRNALYAGDPYALGAQQMRGTVVPRSEDKLNATLAGNIRMIIALDEARYVLLPVELRMEKKGLSQRAVLRLALLDARLGQIAWLGEVASDAVTAYSPAVINSLAARVADLVLAK